MSVPQDGGDQVGLGELVDGGHGFGAKKRLGEAVSPTQFAAR